MGKKKTVEVKLADMEVITNLKRQLSALKGQNTKLTNGHKAMVTCLAGKVSELVQVKQALADKNNAYQGLEQKVVEKDKEMIKKLEEISECENKLSRNEGIIVHRDIEINQLNSTITVLLDRAKTGQL